MNLAQMHFAVNLFCKKFKGIHLKDIENIPNDFVIDIIEDDMVVYLYDKFTHIGHYRISKYTAFYTTYSHPEILYFHCGSRLELNSYAKKSYSNLEEFLKIFEISLVDIV